MFTRKIGILAQLAAMSGLRRPLIPLGMRGEKKACSRRYGPGNAKTYGPNGTRKGARDFSGTVRRFAAKGLNEFGQ